jgi:hypothetical protein
VDVEDILPSVHMFGTDDFQMKVTKIVNPASGAWRC